jgi:hypothetical protein
MKVTMRTQVSGWRDGKEWPAAGEILDTTKDEAEDLIRMGLAYVVAPTSKQETATIDPVVKTATVKGDARSRKSAE